MNQVENIRTAIRELPALTSEEVGHLLNSISCKMTNSGFAEIDVETIDEVADFIAGEMA